MPHASHSLALTISDALAQGATILAPNERAAADLRARHNQSQHKEGLHAWEPAPIHSWNAWLNTRWSNLVTEGHDPRLLLNPAQEHLLWQDIISTGPEFESLGSLDSLATLAQNAWRLAASYLATADLRRHAITHDSRTFAAWAAAFIKRCEQNQYLSTAELASALTIHIANLTAPQTLILIGFNDDTPARTALLNALAARGTTIQHLAATADTTELRAVLRAATPQDETLTAARWIRAHITANPTHRIALIVPRLEDERDTLEAILRNILAPELQSITADLSSTPYAFATGAPLASTAMVATALDLLRWIDSPLPLEQVSALLLSPYLGHSADIEARAAFDAFTLRQTPMLRPDVDIPRLNNLASKSPATQSLLHPLASRITRHSAADRSYADWIEFFRDTLRDANWPGDRPLNAAEFRDASTWDHTLDSVATLDFTGTRVDFRTALDALSRQALNASAAHGSPDAAVQIMSPSDAAGSTFDAIIFLRATDANWPASERPNPLLGWPLQHDLQMPGTDAAATSARAEHATTTLIASAPNVLFSYAAEDESGPQRLSPILEHLKARLGFPIMETADLLPTTENPQTTTLDEVEDTAPSPPLTSNTVRGGALVLKLQAACGFRAFAEMRLGASAIDTAVPGFDARQTGIFLHETMDRFWRAVESQETLKHMPTAERAASLQAAIESSLPRAISPEGPWDDAYIDVQKERMRKVLLQWLDQETARSPFRVTHREQQKQVNVGPLTLSLRMDRVDEVDGGTLLVDYKTGLKSSPKDWETERPDDPQLPLYSLLPESETLQGIAFAKIRPGKDMKWLGYSEGGHIPKPSSMEHGTISEQIEAWRYVLEQLANDFASGKAAVSPKEYPFTCTHCAQRLLCRLDVAAFTADEDEELETADAD